MNVFTYDNADNKVEVNEGEIMLIREFKALFDRDKTKNKTKAFRELTYIYLAIDWKSPYTNYTEQERHTQSLQDAGLSEAEYNDPIFREACRKYRELQESNTSFRLLQAAKTAANKMIDYFEVTLDFDLRKEDGSPIYKAKDAMAELKSVGDVHETLKQLEAIVQKDLQDKSQIWGGGTEDLLPKR